MIVKRFQDLDIYQLSFELQKKIFEISKSFPREETYSLKDQVRRSSRSIGANIVDAWRKRCYPAHFVSKLTDSDSDSDAENAETQYWLDTALACGYFKKAEHQVLLAISETFAGKLGYMISNAESWKPR